MKELVFELLNTIELNGLTDETLLLLNDLLDALFYLPDSKDYVSDIIFGVWKYKDDIPTEILEKIDYIIHNKSQFENGWLNINELLGDRIIKLSDGRTMTAEQVKNSGLDKISINYTTRVLRMTTGRYRIDMYSNGDVETVTLYDCRKEEPIGDKRIFSEYGDVAFYSSN